MADIKLVAAGNYVLVKPIEADKEVLTKGGLVLPEKHQGDQVSVGVLYSIGVLATVQLGPNFHVGGVVNFHTGAERSKLTEVDGEYIMCHWQDIWCVRLNDDRGFEHDRSIGGD